MVWVAYCKVCKETVAWGDNPNTLKSLKHATKDYRAVDMLDENGEPVFDEHGKKQRVLERIDHDCDVFELAELPDIPDDSKTDNIEKPANMPKEQFDRWIKGQKEISKINEIKLILDNECQELME